MNWCTSCCSRSFTNVGNIGTRYVVLKTIAGHGGQLRRRPTRSSNGESKQIFLTQVWENWDIAGLLEICMENKIVASDLGLFTIQILN